MLMFLIHANSIAVKTNDRSSIAQDVPSSGLAHADVDMFVVLSGAISAFPNRVIVEIRDV